MRSGFITGWIAVSIAMASCAAAAGITNARSAAQSAPKGVQASRAVEPMSAPIIDNGGLHIGSVSVHSARHGFLLEIRVAGLEPGGHGLHLHAVGDCDDTATFRHSEGHLSDGHSTHGFLHPDGPHPGDLPNLFVADDGVARVDVFITQVGFGTLTDDDGAALVIHENPDDYRTPPTGASGRRIACAAFPGSGNR